MIVKHESSLYSEFSGDEAMRLVGGQQQPRLVCDGQWAVFPDAVACFAEVGDCPNRSYFDSGSSFCWVADKSYHVREHEHVTFLPDEAVAGTSDGRPIHLFVRHGKSPTFLYLGELEPSAAQRLPGRGSRGEARFLGGTSNRPEDGRIVCVANVVEQHPAVVEVADLPVGWQALRDGADQPWKRVKSGPQEEKQP